MGPPKKKTPEQKPRPKVEARVVAREPEPARGTVREPKEPAETASGAKAHDTRLALLRAAERLMAEKGIDAVSLREVSSAAGQLNNSSVAYHFGSRDALIDAILERHSAPIHERWNAQLDFIARQRGDAPLRPFVEMLVVDVAAKLDDPDGGPEYISLCGQLLVTPNNPLTDRAVSRTPAVVRLIGSMLPFYGVPQALLPMRLERLASTLYMSLLAWHRVEAREPSHEAKAELKLPRDVLVSDLVDALMAVVTEPASPRTLKLLADSESCAPARPARKRR